MRRLLVLLPCLLLLLATSLTPAPRFCPLCGEPVTVQIPTGADDAGGQDRDLLRRARGAQPFMEVATTCPDCGFSGWPEDFPEQKPRRRRGDAEVFSDALRQAFMAGTAVQLPASLKDLPRPPDAPWANLPAFARLDLLAQTVRLRGGEPQRVADLWLQASWAVRMGWHPVHLDLPDPSAVQRAWLMARLDEYTAQAQAMDLHNVADLEVWAAVRLLVGTGDAGPDLHCLAVSTGAALLREHGEHPALLSALPLIQPCVAPEAWAPLQAAIQDSIALERGYERLARDGFAAVLQGGALQGEETALTTYLVGELSRRLGEDETARASFDTALALPDPEGLQVWIREQRCLTEEPDALLGLLRCHARSTGGP
ncbi:MAG: hypothetical protein ABIO70_20005 [Pseudomonadota bacterium]